MSLYTIDQEIQSIIDSIYDSVDENGEVQVDFAALEALKIERQAKCENIALYIKNCEAEAAAIQAEIDSFAKRKERLDKKAEGLKNVLINSMILNGDKELSTPRYRAVIKSSVSTEIDDQSLIPEEFIRVITKDPELKPDKKAIKAAIQAGKTVAGAHLATNTTVKIE